MDDRFKKIVTPGTPAGTLFYAAVFFVFAILWLKYGILRTLLVVLLTVTGAFIGSSSNLKADVAGLINRMFPPKDQKVTYQQEDLEKVKKTLGIKDDKA
ncbi:MAG: DUF2273 domain-containing protein [Clostridiales bacterium]|jgi:uncharacterized membrane protein|nr:DUF2273 domain-containing protein [Clostridiales bacterium]